MPPGYGLRDSETVRELKGGGYIHDWRPAGQEEVARAFSAMLATYGDRLAARYGLHLCDTWPDDPATLQSNTAHFGNSKLAYVFGPKITSTLVDDLEDLGLATRGGRHAPHWVGMHPKLGSVYMTALADAMGSRRKAHPVSDDLLSHVATGESSMDGLAEALLHDEDPRVSRWSPEQAETLMAGLTLDMVVPAGIGNLPSRKLLGFRTRYAAERAALQEQIQAMIASLNVESIQEPDALRDHLQAQYEKLLQPSLADLKRRLRDARIDTTTAAMANIKVTVPAGLAGVGAMMLQNAVPVVAAGPIALTFWEAWRGHRQTRDGLLREQPSATYLYRLARDLQPKDLGSRLARVSRPLRPSPPASQSPAIR